MGDLDPKLWSGSLENFKESLVKHGPIQTEDDATHFLECHFHLVRGSGTKQTHIDFVLELAGVKKPKKKSKKKRKKSERPKLPSTIEEVIKLPDWEEMNGGCFLNMTKKFNNKKKEFTLYFDSTGENSMKLERTVFVPPDTQPSTIDFLSINPEPILNTVLKSLTEKYAEYLFFIDDGVYEILGLAAISSYFREVFDTYPYLDFFSPELNCGKTTAMKCIVWSSFYGFMPLDPTGPVLFRAIDSCKSVVGIDEANNLLKNPEHQSRLLGIFNASYQKGIVAYRIDMEQQGMPVPYDPFGLKAFTHIKGIPPSISDRSIIINMVRSMVKLPLLTTADMFREERDMLYNMRLNIANEVKTTYASILSDGELGLSNRDFQKFVPLMTIAKLISEECYDRTYRWALAYGKKHAVHRVDELSRALVESILRLGVSGDVELKTITDYFNDLCVERELIGMKKDGTPRRFGSKRVLRMLSSIDILKSDHRPQNRVHVSIPTKMIGHWAKAYGLEKIDMPPDVNLDNFDNLDNQQQVNEVIEVTEVIDQGNIPSFSLQAFINPKDAPDILRRLAKYWKRTGTPYKDAIKADDDNTDLLLKGLEAGYVIEQMPGHWWFLTQTAQDEIGRYGL